MQVHERDDAWASPTDAARICAAAARRVGLQARDLEWVRRGERAVLRIDAGRVIARVERPGVAAAEAATEIDIARWLAAADVPVTHPLPVEQPVVVDGMVVTFWYGVLGHPGSVEQLAELLLRVHALTPPQELSRAAQPFRRLRQRIRHAPGLLGDERARLSAVLDAVIADFRTSQEALTPAYVHGDAACHNVLATADGPVLFDFEYAGWGYLEWDLAQPAAYRDIGWLGECDYATFVRTYGRDVRVEPAYPLLRRVRLLRELTGLAQRSANAEVREETRHRIADLENIAAPGTWRHFATPQPQENCRDR